MSDMYERTKVLGKEFPDHFSFETFNTVVRIDQQNNVKGILYHTKKGIQISTMPETTAQMLASKLPIYTLRVRQSLKDIDVLDELIAYRIETKFDEILVAGGPEFTACVIYRHKKNPKRRKH